MKVPPPPSPSPPPFLLTLALALAAASASASASAAQVCIIGSGIAGSSLSHFLHYHRPPPSAAIHSIIFERSPSVGGRMSTVSIAGAVFEAGASIIHPKNLHAASFVETLNLTSRSMDSSSSSSYFGVWDGRRFVFRSLPTPSESDWSLYRRFLHPIVDDLRIFWRYGFSLLKMRRFVGDMLGRFMRYYEGVEGRPVFESVEEMLRWSGLHGLTQRALREELVEAGLSERLISELVTVITRINYGQSVSISGLAGAVSLAGSGSGFWSVKEGNWQIAAGLIKHSNATLHLQEEIISVSRVEDHYELTSAEGNHYHCDVAVVATPLDELNISFIPPISIPPRKLQHTYTTFVHGLINPAYFGFTLASEVPDLVGTVESPDLPFSCVAVQKKISEDDKVYKIFSRSPMQDDLLDKIFSTRKDTIRINWAAYPHFEAPEVFAPFVLDGFHLYYINAFENAASTIETGAVAAENVARLILSRLHSRSPYVQELRSPALEEEKLHLDL
ncbi:Farnesylcysteine lyase [Acorus gramineus]|uniref:Farnesylcysteine lyase n=1 Tax=Acorus gramineus TaxID=55184 RepID=A0AAV9BUP3_ACOGR|nr:Farnesylcysteine lyase [Acorus gramineus]